MPRDGRNTGRIHPHQRDTNNDAPILGANVEILDEHSSSVRQTERMDLEKKSKRDHRNRLKHIYMFWEEKYPDYHAVGVCELTEEELAEGPEGDMYWWKNKHDIMYEGLNVKMVKAFLAHKKKKENGKTCSHVQLQKYYDAVLFGAKKANKHLPQSYYEEMEKFLNAFKKEMAAAKKDEMLDEQDADPISWVLF